MRANFFMSIPHLIRNMAGWSKSANPVSASVTSTAYGFAQRYGCRPVKHWSARVDPRPGNLRNIPHRRGHHRGSLRPCRPENPDKSAESEAEPAGQIESCHRRQVGADRFKADRPPVEANEFNAVRQLDPNLAAGLPANCNFTERGAEADRGDRADRCSRSVRTKLGTARPRPGQDKPVEIQFCRDLQGDWRWLASPAVLSTGCTIGTAPRQAGWRGRSEARGAKQRESGKNGDIPAHNRTHARGGALKQG